MDVTERLMQRIDEEQPAVLRVSPDDYVVLLAEAGRLVPAGERLMLTGVPVEVEPGAPSMAAALKAMGILLERIETLKRQQWISR